MNERDSRFMRSEWSFVPIQKPLDKCAMALKTSLNHRQELETLIIIRQIPTVFSLKKINLRTSMHLARICVRTFKIFQATNLKLNIVRWILF